MNSKFFTNQNENTLLNKIEGIFNHRDIYYLDALVGYFRASGYFKVRPFFNKILNNLYKLKAYSKNQETKFNN